MGILNEPTVRDELAATIAAGLDSSINDTPLALGGRGSGRLRRVVPGLLYDIEPTRDID